MLDFAGGNHSSVYKPLFSISYGGDAPPPINGKKYKKNTNPESLVGKNRVGYLKKAIYNNQYAAITLLLTINRGAL